MNPKSKPSKKKWKAAGAEAPDFLCAIAPRADHALESPCFCRLQREIRSSSGRRETTLVTAQGADLTRTAGPRRASLKEAARRLEAASLNASCLIDSNLAMGNLKKK